MKKIIAFIILVILVILVICLSYNYYKKQDSSRVNKLKTDLETSEILNNKSKSSSDNDDSDKIVVEERDTNTTSEFDESSSKSSKKSSSKSKTKTSNESDDGDSVEETNTNVPDTASNDNNGFVKLDYFIVSSEKDSIKVGKSTKVIVKYYPENASIKDTTFTSQNNNCTVTSLGKVTGLNKGTCSILIKVKGQSAKSLLLTVK